MTRMALLIGGNIMIALSACTAHEVVDDPNAVFTTVEGQRYKVLVRENLAYATMNPFPFYTSDAEFFPGTLMAIENVTNCKPRNAYILREVTPVTVSQLEC